MDPPNLRWQVYDCCENCRHCVSSDGYCYLYHQRVNLEQVCDHHNWVISDPEGIQDDHEDIIKDLVRIQRGYSEYE